MPIQWTCPGSPRCKRSYTYAGGKKAHTESCKHAQDKKIGQTSGVFTPLRSVTSLVKFTENQSKGNITVARTGMHFYKPQNCECAKQKKNNPK